MASIPFYDVPSLDGGDVIMALETQLPVETAVLVGHPCAVQAIVIAQRVESSPLLCIQHARGLGRLDGGVKLPILAIFSILG
jgi:hypothetical protein